MNILKIAAAISAVTLPNFSLAVECDEYHDLALNIYFEARGETEDGMQLVGEVTLNRVESRSFPDNICDVVWQRRQFSWTHDGKSDVPQNQEKWEIAREIAENLINGEIEYFNNGATHFINPDIVSRIPNWTKAYQELGRVGGHVFYADGSPRDVIYMAEN